MSEERELLKRVRDALRELKETHYDLYWDIQTALDQPKQEPVAWMYDLDMMIHPISNTRSQRFGELTAIDPTNRQQDAVNIRPLYTAPPKREPLSEDEIAELWWNTYVVGTADSVRNFARAIEKAHGIGGGE
jgi:hypothetical protein